MSFYVGIIFILSFSHTHHFLLCGYRLALVWGLQEHQGEWIISFLYCQHVAVFYEGCKEGIASVVSFDD